MQAPETTFVLFSVLCILYSALEMQAPETVNFTSVQLLLPLNLPSFLIGISTLLKLSLADAIYNVRFYKMEVNDFEILLIDIGFYL